MIKTRIAVAVLMAAFALAPASAAKAKKPAKGKTGTSAVKAGKAKSGAKSSRVKAPVAAKGKKARNGKAIAARDTPESLAERVLEIEHQLYIEAIRNFLDDCLSIENGCVRIKNEILPTMNMKESA